MQLHENPTFWPKDFVYTRRSFPDELFSSIDEGVFRQLQLLEELPPTLQQGEVHSHIHMVKLTSKVKVAGKIHPLSRFPFKDRPQYALFTNSAVAAGEVLGEYVGERQLIDRWSGCRFKDSAHAWSVRLGCYELILNAKKFANELAFANDYRGLAPAPNVEAKWVACKGRCYLLFITRRAIRAEEEILLDYGENYWRSRERCSLLAAK